MEAARADVVIIGGGVAGLWCRCALRAAGFSVVLIETNALGAGQTVASQGILHSGVKYAFSGDARAASDGLAAAQGAWREALEGHGVPDLRRVRVVAESMHMWTVGGVLDRLTAAAASKVLNSRVRRLEREEFPAGFCGAPAGVGVWELAERAVDPRSLVEELARSVDGPVVLARSGTMRVTRNGDRRAESRFESPDGVPVRIESSVVVFAAGAGNAALLAGASSPDRSQRRPLHMVMMSGAPQRVFGHCPQAASDKPRLTVTTATGPDGLVWYLGGELAESGVERSEKEQIEAARAEVSKCLGWLDVSGARWATFRIDRAEGRTDAGKRPDGPVIAWDGGVAAVWPTKLALAPTAAAQVVAAVREKLISPAESCLAGLHGLPIPSIALAPWAEDGVRWS